MPARPLLGDLARRRAREGSGDSGETVIDLRDQPDAIRERSERASLRSEVRHDDLARSDQLRESRFFGSPAFRRLWLSQVFSSLGDWIGLIAVTAIANRVAGSAGLSLVLAVRLGLAFPLAPFAGVLLDRWNRKYVMVFADFGRCVVLCLLPFTNSLLGLVVASLALELFTLLWAPAKEASVPNLVRADFLPNANSLSLAAAYGTFPFASALFAVLAKVPDWMGQSEHLRSLHLTSESVALYFDALTYIASAAVIASLALSHQQRARQEDTSRAKRAKEGMSEAIEGMRFVNDNPRVRAVVLGLATALIGGGVIVPLGPSFADVVLHAGSGGYGLLLTAMGTGVGIGIVGVSLLQKRLPTDSMFVVSIIVSGAALGLAASMNGLAAAASCIAVLGLCAGAAYVLGFTSLQTNVRDDMRGRVFATFYTLTRACLLASLIAPLMSLALDNLSKRVVGGEITSGLAEYPVPGVRLTLWLGSLIVLAGGIVAVRSLRRTSTARSES